MKILIFGAKGLIGRSLFFQLKEHAIEVKGTVRNKEDKELLNLPDSEDILVTGTVSCDSNIIDLIKDFNPDLVINCLGITKHVSEIHKSHQMIDINSKFPHFLSNLTDLLDFRLINFSTDCIFSGNRGNYKEDDLSDAEDLYGKSKYLGEITDNDRALTLRTSFIGHSAHSNLGLIDWFLSSTEEVKGFSNAIYTGLTTHEIGNFIISKVLNSSELSGLYNLSGKKIDKFNLLKLVKQIYHTEIEIKEDTSIKIDRSLDSSKIKALTGYEAPSWEEQILFLNETFKKQTKE